MHNSLILSVVRWLGLIECLRPVWTSRWAERRESLKVLIGNVWYWIEIHWSFLYFTWDPWLPFALQWVQLDRLRSCFGVSSELSPQLPIFRHILVNLFEINLFGKSWLLNCTCICWGENRNWNPVCCRCGWIQRKLFTLVQCLEPMLALLKHFSNTKFMPWYFGFDIFQWVINIWQRHVGLITILDILWLDWFDFNFIKILGAYSFLINITIVLDFGPVFIINFFPEM